MAASLEVELHDVAVAAFGVSTRPPAWSTSDAHGIALRRRDSRSLTSASSRSR